VCLEANDEVAHAEAGSPDEAEAMLVSAWALLRPGFTFHPLLTQAEVSPTGDPTAVEALALDAERRAEEVPTLDERERWARLSAFWWELAPPLF
jgi:hypothetical protein